MSLRRQLLAGAALLPALWAQAVHTAHAALPTVPTPVHEAAPAASGASSLLQAGFGMAVVVGLIFGCAWLARRFGLQRLGSGNVVKVVSSANVGQRERVVVVEVGDTWLVLGVTPSQVNTLHTLPAQASSAPSAAPTAQAGSPAFNNTVELFARKLRESLSGKSHPAP
ncbi:flagellar protein FliO/FliZ [Variovorax sp. OK605]|jgi:flagellar protein FliO/FliZ|uniref:flagellar biosynthetic protein FliO n=1 Tax=unclassified Variovorax TaxID=663243 RepID=UPI0008AD5B8B|nr:MULTISPECIES: flagellar biosynthetic protein FliO [unclassified Variovorax]SEK16930.1 flagellar protein FliO/FliZ [Variovorax sp. OK202]SFE64747.1 flagellar protein FliO/FliZ [Variovorax sp. OK212]SFQ20689.1 flagellar protein FliO/FliZ [Variovorax sp. OK605]